MMQKLRVIDHADRSWTGDALQAFAWEEIACRQVGEAGVPLLHLWRHTHAVILGLRDRKLPGAPNAMHWLEEKGYRVGVRHSGGAVVPLDAGVLNVTLMLPKQPGQMEMKDDFRLMQTILDRVLRNAGLILEQGEIAGSYCPGEYDLSIGGRKFCGIAQRRQTRAIAVQAFVLVEGSGDARTELVKGFYERAAGVQQEGEVEHPIVRSGTMASLQELSLLTGSQGLHDVAEFRGQLLHSLEVPFSSMFTAAELGLPTVDSGEVLEMAQLIRTRYDC